MNFTAYIQRQKNLIKSRHEGETFLVNGGEVIPLNETEKILKELAELKGLKTHGRGLEREICERRQFGRAV